MIQPVLQIRKITDDVFSSVWIAALILTYHNFEISKTRILWHTQSDIQKVASDLCTKTVQSARISQWCNGDHPAGSYNYLRANGSLRRLTKIGEYNGRKEAPIVIPAKIDKVFEKFDITIDDLVFWYKNTYCDISLEKNSIQHSISDKVHGHLDNDATKPILMPATSSAHNGLQEEQIKRILEQYLKSDGWETKIARGNERGIDIDASKKNNRWIIEVKGPGSRPPMMNNYFLAILGELLQRMSDTNARYSIALPNLPKYRRLWDELPSLAKERTQIDALFVNPDGSIEFC